MQFDAEKHLKNLISTADRLNDWKISIIIEKSLTIVSFFFRFFSSSPVNRLRGIQSEADPSGKLAKMEIKWTFEETPSFSIWSFSCVREIRLTQWRKKRRREWRKVTNADQTNEN